MKQGSWYMTQAALLVHEMYHQLVLLSFPIREYYILVWPSAWIRNYFIILQYYEDYWHSTFHNPIMVLPSFIVDIILPVAKQKPAITY